MAHELQPLQDLRTSKWRIPVKVYQGKYKVWADKNLIFHFTDKTLPDYFKEKLAMINAYNSNGLDTAGNIDFEKEGANLFVLFPPGDSKFLHGVGWRINEWFYCVITPGVIRDSLGGETMSKSYIDEGDKDE